MEFSPKKHQNCNLFYYENLHNTTLSILCASTALLKPCNAVCESMCLHSSTFRACAVFTSFTTATITILIILSLFYYRHNCYYKQQKRFFLNLWEKKRQIYFIESRANMSKHSSGWLLTSDARNLAMDACFTTGNPASLRRAVLYTKVLTASICAATYAIWCCIP